MKWEKVMGTCLMTIFLISFSSSICHQNIIARSDPIYRTNSSTQQKPEFNVIKVANSSGVQLLAMTLDQQDQAHIFWREQVIQSDPTAPKFYNNYLSSNYDNIWTKITIMENSTEVNPIIVSDRENHLHLAWGGYEDGKKFLFYANNIEGTFKPEKFIEMPPSIVTMLIDSKGRPHLVGTTVTDAFYATRDQSWNFTWLSTTNQTSYLIPHLRLDSSEQPHVVWVDKSSWNGPFQLMYAIRVNNIWNLEQVDEKWWPPGDPRPFEYASVDLDVNDVMHISWEYQSRCYEAIRFNGNWTLTNQPLGRDLSCCLLIDQWDKPCIKAWIDENNEMWYAVNKEGTWLIEQVTSEAGPKKPFRDLTELTRLTVVLDSNDEPHFAWKDESGIFYASRGIEAPIIDSPPDMYHREGTSGGLTWHPFDHNPSYIQISRNGTLIEDRDWTGSSITVYLGDLTVGVYQFTLTVFDTNDLSIQDSVLVTVYEIVPVTLTANDWGAIRLTYNHQRDSQFTMALDSTNQPHILWHGPPSNAPQVIPPHDIFYGRVNNGTWKVDYLGISRGWGSVSITIDSNDNFHTVASLGTIEGPLSVAYGQSHIKPSASKTIIGEKAITTPVRSVRIVVDTENKPHVVALFQEYHPVHSKILEYGTIVNGSWQIETISVGAWGSILGTPSLAVDLNNHPHLAWYTSDGIVYATHLADEWQLQLIMNLSVSSSPSIAVDSADLPHIAWEGDNQIYYMRKTGDGWETTQVPISSEQNGAPSLRLDSNDQPHLAYPGMGETNNEIFYTTKTQDIWKTTQLTDNSVSDHSPFLILDQNDLPHIAWVMGIDNNQEIMYATVWDNLPESKPDNKSQFISLTLIPIVFALVIGSFLARRFKLHKERH